jgi:tetratricopeptide (TPR) repeat protein
MVEAHRAGRGAAGAVQRSWTYAVESEVEAKLGNAAGANDLIARSETALGAAGADGGPDWLDFFDASRLEGFKGFCRLATGRPQQAAAALERTLRELPATAAKQRSITLADLAQARAQQGEYEESARLLGAAITQLGSHWYAIGAGRVDGVRRRLAVGGAPARIMAGVDEARRALRTP